MITITGGSGFIGSHLAEKLSEKKAEKEDIVVVDLNNYNYSGNVKPIKYDIRRPCEGVINGDVVFHFAAVADVRDSMKNPQETSESNIMATLNILEACRKNDVKKIVFASTSTVYGIKEGAIKETDALEPVSVYGATKAAAEMVIRAYHKMYGMDAIILRYANIFGPRSRRGVMYDFYKKLEQDKRKLEILGDGKQSKSYLYIKDTIDATLLAAEQKGFCIFNVGSDQQVTVKEIAKIMTDTLGLKDVTFEYTGGEAGWKGDIPRFIFDTSKIKKIGWSQKVSFMQGMEEYVRWLKNE